MPVVLVHRLPDWPVLHHILPLLARLGVDNAALGLVHYAYARGAPKPNLPPEIGGRPELDPPLFAASFAIVGRAHAVLGVPDDATLRYGFHASASEQELVADFTRSGFRVVTAAEVLAAESARPAPEPVPEHAAAPFLGDEGEDDAKVKRLALDALPRINALFPLHDRVEAWDAFQGRLLDLFVERTARAAVPRWSSSAAEEPLGADRAGRLAGALAERGVPPEVIASALLANTLGAPERWDSSRWMLAARFERVTDAASLEALVDASRGRLTTGLADLAALAVVRLVPDDVFRALSAPTLRRLRRLRDEPRMTAGLLAHRAALLADDGARVPGLAALHRDQGDVGPFTPEEAARFRARWEAALARDDLTLAELVDATHGKDPPLSSDDFARHVAAPFARAVAGGLRNADGFGMQAELMAAAPALAKRDPDLLLRGVVALAGSFNENGLRSYLADWDAAVPRQGLSDAARAEAAAFFSSPDHRSHAKIFAKFLAARRIVVTPPAPPRLADVDVTLEVGTDVAHLAFGSFAALERIADVEDPDDWHDAARKQRCVLFPTGGDGWYSMRFSGKPIAELAHVDRATFPLAIKDDTLALSGVVGAGGTPTLAFPSGTYAAHLYGPLRDDDGDETGAYAVVLEAVRKLPRWPAGWDD